MFSRFAVMMPKSSLTATTTSVTAPLFANSMCLYRPAKGKGSSKKTTPKKAKSSPKKAAKKTASPKKGPAKKASPAKNNKNTTVVTRTVIVPPSPQLLVNQIILGKVLSKLNGVTAQLGIPDCLAFGGPKTAVELACMTNSEPEALKLALSALAEAGVYRVDQTGRYSNTPVSSSLTSKGAWRQLAISSAIGPRQ
eukprot:PhF_6_TR19002/c0_g1_i1/m.27844